MGQAIPDYTDEQVNAVQILINTRYGEDTELQFGDSEIQIDLQKKDISLCPVIFWNARDCNFAVMRTGEDQYCAQYFYNPHDQFSTQQVVFTDVEDCVSAVLREQSDRQREEEEVKDGAAAANTD